jgi:5-formyltetrahydrofolate cyclo-ligase
MSQDIIREISNLASYRGARVVLAYAGFGSELQTGDFLRRTLELGKTLLLPRVNRETKSLDIYEVKDLECDLKPGIWGIREPNPDICSPADTRAVDFVLVPGVAFDSRGGRLGYGAGFYDRLLANRPSQACIVAGAFEIQMIEHVPMHEHDVPVDVIVTEQRHYLS